MSVDISGTSWDQCVSMVQYCFTSMETRRLVRTDSQGRPPRLSHSSWTIVNSLPRRYLLKRSAKSPAIDSEWNNGVTVIVSAAGITASQSPYFSGLSFSKRSMKDQITTNLSDLCLNQVDSPRGSGHTMEVGLADNPMLFRWVPLSLSPSAVPLSFLFPFCHFLSLCCYF